MPGGHTLQGLGLAFDPQKHSKQGAANHDAALLVCPKLVASLRTCEVARQEALLPVPLTLAAPVCRTWMQP